MTDRERQEWRAKFDRLARENEHWKQIAESVTADCEKDRKAWLVERDRLTRVNEYLRAEDARLRNALLTTCADYNAEAVAERDRLKARVCVLDDEVKGACESLDIETRKTSEQRKRAERAEAKVERVDALGADSYCIDGTMAVSWNALRAALADEENSGDVTHHSPDAEDMVRDDYDAEA